MRTVYPTGTTVYDPGECRSGYTILNGYLRSGRHSVARVMQSGEADAGAATETEKPRPEQLDIGNINRNGTLHMGAHRISCDHCPQLAAVPRPPEADVLPPPHTALKPY